MTEPRRSTRARAREEAEAAATPTAPEAIEKPSDTPSRRAPKSTLKRKRAEVVKDTTPANATPEVPREPSKPVLPIKVIEGEPLPTLPDPQPLDLPSSEYQDVRESGVLSASLQRSRAIWTSGSNFRLFHKHFVGPKKVADRTDEDKAALSRQKEIQKNFPQLGGNGVTAQLTIEPHTFSIRLYGPRETTRHVQKKPAPVPQYGQWPNHNQAPYYHHPQHHPQHPPQTPQMHHPQHMPQQHRPSYSPATPYVKPTPPPPRPPQPKPQEKPPPPNPPPATAAPDPVIHMLAQRAGVDPVLKQTMKVVAEGRATKEELELFQKHINEFNLIVEKQKAEAARAAKAAKVQPPPSPAPASQAPYRPPPAPYQPPPTSQTPQNPQPPQTPQTAGHPPQQPQQHHQQYPPRPYQSPMPQAPQQHAPPPHIPPQPRHTPHPNQYTYNQHHHQHMAPYSPAVQAPRTTYRPLIFDFAEEGNQDKFYFPSYSIMEWLPNNQGAKFSFLLTKMKNKPKEEVKKETVQSTPATNGTSASSNTGNGVTNGTSNPAGTAPGTGTPAVPATPVPNSNQANPNTPSQGQPPVTPGHGQPQSQGQGQPPLQPPPPPQQQPQTPQQQQQVRIEAFDERNDIADIEFYYPVTMIVQATHYEILQSLPRAVRPPEVVVKYMEEVFDKCKRAEETFLAFRLPKEGAVEGMAGSGVASGRGSGEGTPAVGIAGADMIMGEVVERKRARRA